MGPEVTQVPRGKLAPWQARPSRRNRLGMGCVPLEEEVGVRG